MERISRLGRQHRNDRLSGRLAVLPETRNSEEAYLIMSHFHYLITPIIKKYIHLYLMQYECVLTRGDV